MGAEEPAVLFTENETNSLRLHGVENYTSYTRDAFHRHIINGKPLISQPL